MNGFRSSCITFAFVLSSVASSILAADSGSKLDWSADAEKGQITIRRVEEQGTWTGESLAEVRFWDAAGKEQSQALSQKYGWKIESTPIDGGCRLLCRQEALGISIPLDFAAAGEVLTVGVPATEIVEAGAARLKALRLLPQFGAGCEGEDGYLVIAQQSGALCHFRDKKPGQNWVSVYQSSCQCPMPLFGVVRGKSAVAAIVTGGQFDARFCVGTNWGPQHRYSIDPEFALRATREVARLPDDLRVEYHLLPAAEANWMGIGKSYRQYNFSKRALRPLRDRAAGTPALAYSAGAMEVRIRLGVKPVPYEVKEQTPETEPPVRVFCDFKRVRDIVGEFHRQGIGKAEFCLVGWNKGGHDGRYPQIYPVEPALGGEAALRETIQHGQSLGYQMVAHDCYYDAYRISEDWNEEYLLKDPAGKPVKGGVWGGGQSYKTCLKRAYELFASRDMPRTRDLGFQGLHYSDVLSIIGPHACSDPKHPQTKRQDAESATRILALAKKTFGGVQSEGSLDFTAPALDRLLYVDCDKWLPLSKRPYVDTCVPLYESVYHGVMLYSLSTNAVNSQPGEDAYLKSIEYGAVPLTYFYGHFLLDTSKNWLGKNDYRYDDPASLKQIVTGLRRVYDDVQQLKHLQMEFLEGHRQLAENVFETTYGNGERVVVNYREQSFALPSGLSVPARAYALLPAPPPAKETAARTDWLKDDRLGAFMHFLPGDPASFAKVKDFDVEALAKQLEAMGAKYFVFTLGQNSGWFNAPNAVYDRITGYQPGERCAARDLPLDLSRALKARGIRLMLYLPCQTPNRDPRAQKAFGLAEGPKDQPTNLAFAAKWAEVIHEWSARYGDKVSGWWFDGGYARVGFNEEIARLYADAVKRGNPDSIVTFNPGVRLIRHTQAEDYTAGELNDPFDVLPTGRWVNGSQWHALTFLGSTWSKRDVRYPTNRWCGWFQQVVLQGGAVTLDIGPNWKPEEGPIGSIDPAQAEQFREIASVSNVKVEKTTLTLPTYPPGPPDKNPIFYTGRVYQGAQGRVYPYPLQDVLHDEKVDQTYTALCLENEYLKASVLPEIGGRLFNFTDKDTGFEIFYRQSVVKPALIGMLGAWTSGGVEWNFPHHHRATTYMPVDYATKANADGSKTIWIGETELRQRMKWSIGLTMRPGRSYLEADCRFMNPQPYIQSMLYWANVSVHCGADYQVLFPPNCRVGADHHKAYFTRFPMGRPCVSEDAIADLSWWKNFTTDHRSIFAIDPDNDFLAGYDHGRELGTVHVANHHVVCGKKFFLWGNNPGGFVWDKVLTDRDGPYLELMVGAYSDNQPDYSWISPYETRSCKQFWYPVKKIGGVKCATIDAAINLERRSPQKVFLGFNATAKFKSAKVILKHGADTYTEVIDIDPNTPYLREIAVAAMLKDREISGRLIASDGRELVRYSTEEIEEKPLPERVENPKPPREYKTGEELYLTGLRLEQFHNGIVDPLPYYEEALRRDPMDERVNTVMGIRLARQARFKEAEQHLRRAVDRATRNYTRAKDVEAHYYLGVVLKEQGRLKEAADEFWKAVWRDTFQREAYMELAGISCLQGDHPRALELVEHALDVAARCGSAHTLKAFLLRKLGRKSEAAAELAKTIELDPLDVWSVAERSFLEGRPETAVSALERDRGDKLQQLLETVTCYGNIGAFDEALTLLSQAKPCPLVGYSAGYYNLKKGITDKARALFDQAAKMPTDYCFPFRHEELNMLSAAAELCPADANTWYYLGDLCYYLEQREQGIDAWEKATALNPGHGLALRNLGFAYSRIPEKRALAVTRYETAIQADPGNVANVIELDKLFEKQNRDAAARLAFLESHFATVQKSDPATLRLAYLYNEMSQYDKSLAILSTRRFHVWEGAAALHQPFVDANLLRGLAKLDAGKIDEALRDFKVAGTYPENLQAGRPGDAGQAPKIHYYTAQAYRAKGDAALAKSELRLALDGRVAAGEMNYYRRLACRELGDAAGEAREKELLLGAIAELEQPETVDAYAKFGGENTPNERQSSRSADVAYLKGLQALADDKTAVAKDCFNQALKLRPGMVWAKFFLSGGAEEKPAAVPDLTKYIITPPAKPAPRFNGASVFGVRPGNPILYTVAVAGQRPLTLTAEGLPEGVSFDAKTGRITGAVAKPGTYPVKLRAENAAGKAERELKLVVGDNFSLTPPMGCNTWGGLGPFVSEKGVRASAEALVKSGLLQHGYCYVNIDDGWQGQRGGPHAAIQPNEKFGDMKKFCDDLHALGLKVGNYSTPWRTSYAGFVGGSSEFADGAWEKLPPGAKKGWTHGRYRFEINDARQAAEWGIDYFKYDWGIDRVELAKIMGDALRAQRRDIVLELSNSAPLKDAAAYTGIGTMTRTAGDLVDVWVKTQLDPAKQKWALGIRDLWLEHKKWQPFNRPGHWNMPCPLRVGMLGGWDQKPLRPSRLTVDEQFAHISLWCLWGSPIIIGAPIDKLDAFTLSLLTNDEVLDVDQDPLGLQAIDIDVPGGEILVKKLADGGVAVGLFNPGEATSNVEVSWAQAGVTGEQQVRDLWRQKDLGVFSDRFSATVPSHGVVLVKLTSRNGQ